LKFFPIVLYIDLHVNSYVILHESAYTLHMKECTHLKVTLYPKFEKEV
jgi:hypothetical protein